MRAGFSFFRSAFRLGCQATKPYRHHPVLHQVPDGNCQLLPDYRGHLGRRHVALGLAVGLGHDGGAVGVGQALHFAARLDHVVNGQL